MRPCSPPGRGAAEADMASHDCYRRNLGVLPLPSRPCEERYVRKDRWVSGQVGSHDALLQPTPEGVEDLCVLPIMYRHRRLEPPSLGGQLGDVAAPLLCTLL